MKVGLFTCCHLRILRCWQYAKEVGLDVDVIVYHKENPKLRANIALAGMKERVFKNDTELIQMLNEYDIIHLWELCGSTRHKKIYESCNKPIVCECSWNIPTYGTNFYFTNMLSIYKLSLEKVKFVIARSKSVYDAAIQDGYDPNKVETILDGCIDIKLFTPRPKPEHQDKLVFLFMGRVVEQKGIFEIFHSFVRANIPNSILIYSGPPHPTNPWDRDVLIKWIKKLGLEDRVFIRSEVSEEEVPSAYNRGDVFITLPNTNTRFVEQVGITTPEALASGLPVITYDFGGQAEFITDTNGIKIHNKDYIAGAEAMKKLADPEIRKAYSKAARGYAVKHLDNHAFPIRVKAIYGKVLKNLVMKNFRRDK